MGREGSGGDDLTTTVFRDLLPTPSTSNRDGNQTNNRGELLLPGVAEALLPSPVVTDSAEARNSTAGRTNDAHAGHSGDTLLDAMTKLGLADPGTVLPTPVVDPTAGNGHARDLGSELALLPSPAASLPNDGEDAAQWRARHERNATKADDPTRAGMPLAIAVQTAEHGPAETTADGDWVRWGKYRAAIKRTEAVLGRLAPSPTRPDGKGGKRRLAARFVEWMMLVAEGWVTGVPGISRRDQLKLLGNGVVPPQAEAACTILLGRVRDRLAEQHTPREQYERGLITEREYLLASGVRATEIPRSVS